MGHNTLKNITVNKYISGENSLFDAYAAFNSTLSDITLKKTIQAANNILGRNETSILFLPYPYAHGQTRSGFSGFGNYGQERPRGDRRDQLLRRYCCGYLRDIRDGKRM